MEEGQRLEIRASKRINILEDLAEIARTIKHEQGLNLRPKNGGDKATKPASSFQAKLKEINARK